MGLTKPWVRNLEENKPCRGYGFVIYTALRLFDSWVWLTNFQKVFVNLYLPFTKINK